MILIVLMLFLGGCNNLLPSGKTIQDQAIVTVLAVDKALEGYTLSCAVQTSAGENSESENKSLILKSEGASIAQCVLNMQSFVDKSLFLGHIEFYLIGEGLASEGLRGNLDFFAREFALNLSSNVFITKGNAFDLLALSMEGDSDLFRRLKSLAYDAQNTSKSFDCSLLKFLCYIEADYPFLAPVLKPNFGAAGADRSVKSGDDEEKTQKSEQDEGQSLNIITSPDLTLSSYAIIKEGKMIMSLADDLSVAATLLTGKGKHALFEADGAVFEMTKCKLKRDFSFEKGELKSARLTLNVFLNINELNMPLDITNRAVLGALSDKVAQKLCAKAEEVMKISRDCSADFAFLLRYALRASPRARILKIDDLPVTIRVNAKIERTYDIK